MRQRFAAYLLSLAAALGAGCGSDDANSVDVPADDPEAVVRAYFEARASCGEEAAEQLVATTTGSSAGQSDEETIERIVDEDRAQGCTPQPTGEIATIVQSQSGEVAIVEGRVPEGPDAGTHPIRAVRTDEGWKVDTGAGG